MKKKVLIMTKYYLPSVKGGGPIQSIKNIVNILCDEFDFYIVTSDRDLGDEKPFENIAVDKWIKVGEANVYYTNVPNLNREKIKKIIVNSKCEIIYLNSFFDYKFTIIPLILNRINKININKIIVAPRGQFSPGALKLKRGKKKLFIKASKILGLYNDLSWHATAASEKKHIQSTFGNDINIIVANNLTKNYEKLIYEKKIEKIKGELIVVFVSRIHPKKNLKRAIQFLQKINGDVIFNIYGPIEDTKYWDECKKEIKLLPESIKVIYKGVVDHDKIMDLFENHHILLFPTLGENFGHVISEALIGGCPVIISDQTPWRNLEQEAVGSDIDLNQEEKFLEVIQEFINQDQLEYNYISRRAFNFGLNKSNSKEDLINTKALFLS